MPIKDLMSSCSMRSQNWSIWAAVDKDFCAQQMRQGSLEHTCVGQDFWHGASAHFRQRAASLKAARSLSVVCLTSSKFFVKSGHFCKQQSEMSGRNRTTSSISKTCPKKIFSASLSKKSILHIDGHHYASSTCAPSLSPRWVHWLHSWQPLG
jgi:hypothetical protein